MKIGTILTLEIESFDHAIQKYRSKVIEADEEYLYIDYPIDQQTNKTIFLPKNKDFRVRFVDESDLAYTFRASIIANVKLPIPALSIKKPKKEDLQHIQRRKYVRIDVAIDVAIHSHIQDTQPFTTVTQDISGGGLSLILPTDVKVESGDTLETWLVLPIEEQLTYLVVETEVIRTFQVKHHINIASLCFKAITDEQRQAIIHYCFEVQRQARRKELR